MQSAPRALIAGLGLIGGSIGIALRRRGWRVAYDDPNVDASEARQAEAADERIGAKSGDYDLLIIATPVDAALQILQTTNRETRITSVCGVMVPLREAADRQGLNLVAGHPLAGSHERALAAARADLFRNKRWFVDRDDPLVSRVIRDCDAQLQRVDPRQHDAAVAVTSHLPQILSTALAAYIGERRAAGGGRELLDFAGSGLETFLRLAGSDASVWRPLIESNRANIQSHIDGVLRVVRDILDGDSKAFARAQQLLRDLTNR
ncbi:MAG: hypothetical protein DMF57_10995 [Acidobacteria bacterium]|nr:MAG: hypothetical protein DMF57_10995 [Acidobacteriota bacterium]